MDFSLDFLESLWLEGNTIFISSVMLALPIFLHSLGVCYLRQQLNILVKNYGR